ncbi:hypothetical protein [Bradyrhizobium sp.]|uniref:hypothetical protein n=1 Tax=Bradyrhizobium sp. TaxID=376 RepID=UPI00263766F8|nr:hypothetical protein [Bradyrhizobium sp.]
MDAETIQMIAAELAKHSPHPEWWQWAIQVLIVAVSAGIAVFVSEYLRTKGKNLATRADFDSLKLQLRENTELVENIKAEVGQKDWAAREWKNTRRIKLEELLAKMHECDAFADRFRHISIEGVVSTERDPVGEMETIGALYFPELQTEIFDYALAHRQHKLAGSSLATNVIQSRDDLAKRQFHFDAYTSGYEDRLNATSLAQSKLNAAARRLLVQIVGLDSSS